MSWYSLLGIAVGAWVAASLGATLLLGLLSARSRTGSRRGAGTLAPVVVLDHRRAGRTGSAAGRRAAG